MNSAEQNHGEAGGIEEGGSSGGAAVRGEVGTGVGQDSVARILEEVRQAAPPGEEADRLTQLAERARLLARAAAKLAAKLAKPRRTRVRDADFRTRWSDDSGRPTPPRSSGVETWSAPPLVVLAVAILVPALHFFGTKTRNPATGCLEVRSDGYGRTSIGPAHRVSIMFALGTLAEDKLVCHRCDNKPCVEPSHLYVGTFADNNRDTVTRGRRGLREKTWPKFTTWDEWKGGGWDASETKDPPQADGAGFEFADCELPPNVRAAVMRAPSSMAYEDDRHGIFNPDLWSENDEHALMVLGRLDRDSPEEATHCRRGHELTEANTYRWRDLRQCRACARLRDAQRRRA